MDIRPQIIQLGASSGGYDERGLLGLAFHPEFHDNGLFYLHYTLAGTQGSGALPGSFKPDPCDPETLNLKWINRDTRYDHIDTVEEWIYQTKGQSQKRRTLLTIRRPFLNHNGVSSLNFSPETGNLVLTTGDGGSGYDPFNLSQDDMEIAGKIIEINVATDVNINPPVVTRFDELSVPIRETITVIAKGVRNIPGIAYQRFYESIYQVCGPSSDRIWWSRFSHSSSISRSRLLGLLKIPARVLGLDQEGFVNFGWRGWEGAFPTSIITNCANPPMNEKTSAYYEEAIKTSVLRLPPLTCYYHQESQVPTNLERPRLQGVQPYMGRETP